MRKLKLIIGKHDINCSHKKCMILQYIVVLLYTILPDSIIIALMKLHKITNS